MRDPYDIWAFVTRSSNQHDQVAEYCGVDPQDPAFKSLMRSMVISGFLRHGFNCYVPGNQPPPGTLRPLRPGETASEDLRDRLPPSGVPFAEAVPGPAAAGPAHEKPLPPGLLRRPDGVAEVEDDVLDRVAKADVIPAVGELATQARYIREQYQSDDWGDDDESDMLERLLDLVDKAAAEVGHGTIGEVGAVVPYDPAMHQYTGKLPPGGITRSVVVTLVGQTWTHRGRVMVITKAFVDLHDDDMGQFTVSKAADLDNDVVDPRIVLWFNDAAPHKPEGYADEDWYRCTRAIQAVQVYDDCEDAECDHPKDDKGGCNIMLFLIEGAQDYLEIPCDQLITSGPADN